MMRLSEQLLRADAAQLKQTLPMDVVALGRTLHWLRDPSAPTYLQQATREQVTRDTDDPEVLIRMGQVTRLSDDPARAQQYWQRTMIISMMRFSRCPRQRSCLTCCTGSVWSAS